VSRVINQGVVITIKLNNVGQVQQQLNSAGSKGQNIFAAWSSTIATIQKALLSMIGVLTAWTLFITIPEKLAAAFKELAIASVTSAAEMERSILSLAGLLSSFRDFGGKDIAENFALATQQSEKLLLQFNAISASSLASAQDLLLVYQTLVSRGGLEFVKTQEEALKLTRLLADTILVLTGGQQKERQLVSETSALFEGQARAGSLLAKIIASQVGNLQQWLEKERAAGTLLQDLQKMFGGIDVSSAHLANTMEGILNSIKSQLVTFNIFMQRVGALQEILNWLKGIRDSFAGALDQLNRINETGTGFSEKTLTILNLFGSFNVLLHEVVLTVQSLTTSLFGTTDPIKQSAAAAAELVVIFVHIRAFLESTIDVIKGLKAELMPVIDTLVAASKLMFTPEQMVMHGGFTEFLKDFKQHSKDIGVEMQRQAEQSGFFDKLKIELQEAQDLMKITVAGMVAQFKNLDDVTGTIGASIRNHIVQPTKEQLDFAEQLEDAYRKARDVWAGKENIFETVSDKALKNVREINEHLQNQSALRTRALNINMATLQTELESTFHKYLEDDVKAMHDRFDLISAENVKIMEATTLERVRVALMSTGTMLLKDLLDLSQSAADDSRELIDTFRDLSGILRDGSFEESAKAIKQLPKIYMDLNIQLEKNKRLMTELQAKKGMDVQMDKQIDNAIAKLVRDNVAVANTMRATAESIRQDIMQFDSMDAVIQRLVIRLVVFKQKLKEAFGQELKAFIGALAQSLQSFFASLVNGVDNGVPIWKRFLATILNTLAAVAAALGALALAGAQIPIFGHLFGGYAGAIAMFAAAGILSGLAARLGGGGSSASAGAGSSGGGSTAGNDRQVIFEPTANFEALKYLKETANKLAQVTDNISGVSPGQIVAMGAKGASKEIAAVVKSSVQSSPQMRQTLQGAVFGEAG
jgi:hypothetical protein